MSCNRHHVSPHPSLDCRPQNWKLSKLSLIVFRDKFYQKQYLWCAFSFSIMTYLENLIGIKSLNKKQCPPGFSPIIIPSPCIPLGSSLSFQKTAKLSGFDES